MSSHLLEGKVRHRRAHPVTYHLEHDVFYAALDLDEIDTAVSSLRLMARNRWNERHVWSHSTTKTGHVVGDTAQRSET